MLRLLCLLRRLLCLPRRLLCLLLWLLHLLCHGLKRTVMRSPPAPGSGPSLCAGGARAEKYLHCRR